MSQERTYLELSEDSGSHKFYEVVVEGVALTIRYGRIGDAGQTKVSQCASEDKARAEAAKKIAEKTKKGYVPAVLGGRAKRQITRRETTSTKSSANQAPVLWKFASSAKREGAFGIFVDEARVWVGNQDGSIFSLDHHGNLLLQLKLPEGVKCIVADDDWLYAGCDDGKVYDLGSKVPRVAYAISDDVDIYWLDIKDGMLGVSDAGGNVVLVNHEDESQWRKKSSGVSGWMIRCDELGVFHGHSNGVTMYDWEDGSELWSRRTDGAVLFGWQEESSVFAATANRKVHRFSKRGEGDVVYACDDAVFSCAAAEDGKYVFAADNSSSIYCFDAEGTRLWKLGTGCGSALSMQYYGERLYLVTSEGTLASLDVGDAAIAAARAGTVAPAKNIATPTPVAAATPGEVETTGNADDGVVVEVVKDGAQLRVRVLSSDYRQDWFVQFPKELRHEGARYVVDEVRESARGSFYRAHGGIRRLVP